MSNPADPYQGQPYGQRPEPYQPDPTQQYPHQQGGYQQGYGHYGSSALQPQQSIYIQNDTSNNSALAPVTSIVTGLIGLFLSWIPIIGIVAWILGPLALVFGILGLRRGRSEHKIMSMIGIVAGGLALLICFGYVIALTGALSSS